MKIERIVVGALQVNCYLVGDPEAGQAVLVDPGADPDRILAVVKRSGWTVTALVNTHFHVDHVGSNAPVREALGDPPLMIGREDGLLLGKGYTLGLSRILNAVPSPEPDRLLDHGDRIEVGTGRLEVRDCPGHSPGGISLVGPGFVLTGDTLFREGIGRTDFPGCSYEALVRSIGEQLLTLPGETRVLPGHGPESTVEHERRANPFLDGIHP